MPIRIAHVKNTPTSSIPLNICDTKVDITIILFSLIDLFNKDLIILDVREPKDFNNGHLLNAINIPIEDIDKRMDELRNYKSKDIIVYCNTGRKSAEVAEKLVEHGFTDVTNIVDGVSEYDFKLVK